MQPTKQARLSHVEAMHKNDGAEAPSFFSHKRARFRSAAKQRAGGNFWSGLFLLYLILSTELLPTQSQVRAQNCFDELEPFPIMIGTDEPDGTGAGDVIMWSMDATDSMIAVVNAVFDDNVRVGAEALSNHVAVYDNDATLLWVNALPWTGRTSDYQEAHYFVKIRPDSAFIFVMTIQPADNRQTYFIFDSAGNQMGQGGKPDIVNNRKVEMWKEGMLWENDQLFVTHSRGHAGRFRSDEGGINQIWYNPQKTTTD